MNNLPQEELYVDEEDSGEGNKSLPIFQHKLEVIEAVRKYQFVIIHGETGCGKTTQIPQYLFKEKLNGDGAIGITQPRKVAALRMAKRVAQEMNSSLGKTVGYEVRFDKKCQSTTKIKYMTDGILLNECIVDKKLNDYGIIIIDEAHERSVVSDVLLGLLKMITKKREDLKVIISSATISVDKFIAYFENAKAIEVKSRQFEVDVIYRRLETDYIEKTVQIVREIHAREMAAQANGNAVKGHVLVFLTGYEEIEICCDELRQITDVVAIPFCSAMDSACQNEVFEDVKPFETKVVVATNIAETSLTIDGIKYVIDCGYVKQNKYNPKRGMEVLEDVRVSKAQADQRKGRAGRTQPGICYRLYHRSTYEEFDNDAVAEIYRKNLSEICLRLRAIGLDPKEFNFLDMPELEELKRSEKELLDLSLMTEMGALTSMGAKIATFPLDPILGKVLMTSVSFKCTADVVCIVSMISEKMHNIFRRPKNKSKIADDKRSQFHDPGGDHFALLKVYNAWKIQKDRKSWCLENFVDGYTLKGVENVIKQINFILAKHKIIGVTKNEDNRMNIKKCFIAGYFRNICIRQPRDIYNRVSDDEVFLIHGSSTLKESRPKIILFHGALKSTKSFATGVMQLEEELLRDNFKKELELIKFPIDIDAPTTF